MVYTPSGDVDYVFLSATPVLANPGNGNGGGHGIFAVIRVTNGNGRQRRKCRAKTEHRKMAANPDHVESDISYAVAGQLAVNLGLTGLSVFTSGDLRKIWREENRCRRESPSGAGVYAGTVPYYPGYGGKSLGIIWC